MRLPVRPRGRELIPSFAALLALATGCGGTSVLAPLDATVDTATPDVSPDVAVDVTVDAAPDSAAMPDAPADVAPDKAPPPDDVPLTDAMVAADDGPPAPECTTLAIEPAMVRVATGRGVYLRAVGGSSRGALFALAPGADTGGAALSPGGSLLAGPRAAAFTVVASDPMCSAMASARVEVVGPFVLEPTDVRMAPGRSLRFVASGALGTVRWDVLQRPVEGTRMGDGTLDSAGMFSSGTVAGIYRLRASDAASGSEVQATVTVDPSASLAPAASTVLVPRGRTVRLDWRGGSRYVNASITGGTAGGAIVTSGARVLFDATTASPGTAVVSAMDRYTNEVSTVRVVVGDEVAPPPVPRGPVNFVGDMALGDVNRDGRVDLVLGQANRSENGNETGAVVVFHGQADGRYRPTPDTVINGLRDADLFGTNVLVADVDGDRYDDVVVGSPTQDLGRDGRGSVQVFLGSASGLATTPERTFVGENNADSFGTSMAVEDLDGDGVRDLLVTAPNAANPFVPSCGRAGRVYLYRGLASTRGLYQTIPWQVLDVRDRLDDLDGPPQCRASSFAGTGLALLDLDGDGFRDLALGAPGNGAPNFGSVIVYRGTARGLFEEAPAWVVHVDAAQRTNNPRLGFGLDVVSVSATQKVLAVRVPSFGQNPAGASASNAGGFFVLRPGTFGAVPAAGTVRVVTTAIATARFAGVTNEAVGRAGAAGDLDGDGDLDYVVGAGNTTADGALYVFEASALAGTGLLTTAATVRGDMASLEALGQRVAFGPAAVGMAAPFAALSAFRSTPTAVFGGAVRALPAGAPQPFMDRWTATVPLDVPVLPAADRTGTAVALGALRTSTPDGIVVSSPGAHSAPVAAVGTTAARPAGFRARTGAADVFGASGPAARRFWVDRSNIQLGAAVAVLDFDGDGRDDVALGDPGDSSGGTDMIARATPPLANTATDPCWYRTGATGTTVVTASVGGRGIVRVYLQNADGTFREGFWAIPRESVPTGGTARRTGFGFSLASAGDVNGDGIRDLLVGRSGGGGNNGAEVVLGRRADAAGRISVVCSDATASPFWASRADNIAFGVAVAGVGDLDDDGCAETAVSLSGSGRAGVSLQYGYGPACRRGHTTPHEILIVSDDRPLAANETPPGGTPRPVAMRIADWVDLPGAATSMGLILAGGGDLNGDRVPDLVFRDAALAWRDRSGPALEIISGAYLNGLCPEHGCAVGLVNGRFYSDGAGYNIVGVRTLGAPQRVIVPAFNATSVRFGSALAVNDLDGDGNADLVVGAADDATQGDFAGAVMAWRASSDPESFVGAPWLFAVGDVAEPSQFGAALATSRDATGAWLAVGAPFSSHRGAQTGAAYRWRIER